MPRVEPKTSSFGGEPADPKHYPRYKSHKIVEAFKIKEVKIDPTWLGRHVLVPEKSDLPPLEVSDEYVNKHDPKPGGFYVRYPDGYESWSPAKAFEEGYTEVTE